MKVKEIIDVLSPYQSFQIGDSKTGEPITYVSYLADSGCEAWDYGDYKLYGIAPKVNKDGKPYLALFVEMTV